MRTKKYNQFTLMILVVLILGLLLPGCTREAEWATEEVQVTLPPPTDTVDTPPTTVPSEDNGGEDAGLPSDVDAVLLIVTGDAPDAGMLAEVNSAAQQAASENNWVVVNQAVFNGETGNVFLQAVVVFPGAGDPASIASTYPQSKVIALNGTADESLPNLVVLNTSGANLKQAAFLAGYTAAMLTENWRIGVISVNDTDQGVELTEGFLNGAYYMCGLCSPTEPPFYEYPQSVSLASSAAPDQWRQAADGLLNEWIGTIYLAPGAGDASLREYLASEGVILLGSEIPAENIRNQWGATFLPSLKQSVYELVTGGQNTGSWVNAGIQLTFINETFLTIGKKDHLNEVISLMENGFISVDSY